MRSNCPFNYSGSKSNYPNLFDITDRPILDLFAGGGGFYSNCQSDDIIANDIIQPLIEFQERVYNCSEGEFEELIKKIYDITSKIDTKEKYNHLRDRFNKKQDDILFYSVLSCCMSNKIRFNQSGGFNQSWGRRKFNKSMEKKLRDFRERIKEKNIQYLSKNFKSITAPKNYVLFVDPPYLVTEAGYSGFWDREKEKELYEYMSDKEFIMTNFLERGEKYNDILAGFIEDQDLDYEVINSNQMKGQNKKKDFKEILVKRID